MKHAMTVCANHNQILQRGDLLGSKLRERHPMMDFGISMAKFAVNDLEVEPATRYLTDQSPAGMFGPSLP